MMRTNGYSKALFGGLLWGDQPLRYVFMDEAGTSDKEPVAVVVGIIASADEHVMSAEALVSEILGSVPPEHREGFTFHAMQLYGDKKYHDTWGLTDRLALLKKMMSVPRRIGMAVTVSAHWLGAVDYSESVLAKSGLSPKKCELYMAYLSCIANADSAIRQHAGPREVATVVAEDNQELRGRLKLIPHMLRDEPIFFAKEHMRETETDKELGYMSQSREFRVTRIRNSVHFVEKAEDPLVQVADACAYGFRRFFAGEKFGVDFVQAILENEHLLRRFASPSGVECFWPAHLAVR